MEEDLGCDREQPLSTRKNLLPSGARGFRRKAADSLCAPLGRAFAWARWPHARSPGTTSGSWRPRQHRASGLSGVCTRRGVTWSRRGGGAVWPVVGIPGGMPGEEAADLPRKLLLLTFAGFVNRDQARLIANLLPFSWFAMPANCNR